VLPDEAPEDKLPPWLHAMRPVDKPVVDAEDKASFAEDGFDDEFDMETGPAGAASAAEMERKGTLDRLRGGEVVLLNVPVKPGEPLGYVGKYGTEGNLGFHFEIFSKEPIVDLEVHKDEWKLVPADEDTDLIATPDRVADMVDATGPAAAALGMPDNDGRISAAEVKRFFHGADEASKKEVRRLVTRHVSEWSTAVDYAATLTKGELFRWADEHAVDDFVAEAKTMRWYSDVLAADLELPEDGIVYHYHPIRFIEWFVETQGGTLAEIAKGSGGGEDDAGGGVTIECDDLPEDERKSLGCEAPPAEESDADDAKKKGEAGASYKTSVKVEGGALKIEPDKARCGESELGILRAEAEAEAAGKDE
jgi:hypothetical protein